MDEYELLDLRLLSETRTLRPLHCHSGRDESVVELTQHEWKQAVAFHSGDEKVGWQTHKEIPEEWLMRFDTLTFQAR